MAVLYRSTAVLYLVDGGATISVLQTATDDATNSGYGYF
jgi:hypothetical protein